MKTLEERFFSKVHINTKSGCWEWTGSKTKGYGIFDTCVPGKTRRAHRLTYEMTGKEIKKGNFICHTCDNRSCVNPFHLFQGTTTDNMRDMIRKGRARHPHGSNHYCAKIEENTVVFIRQFIERNGYGSCIFLARWLDIDNSVIGKIKNRKIWSHVS